MTKFNRIKRALNDYWGFGLTRNTSDDLSPHGWKTGFMVCNTLRRMRWVRHSTLKEIDRIYLSELSDMERKKHGLGQRQKND